MPLNFAGTPATVTSKGLRVDLHLRECHNLAGADYAVTLGCEKVVDGHWVAPVLYLRRLWCQGNQFARVFAGKRSFERVDTEPKNQGFSETVFVRQKPSSALPLIRISQEKDAFPDMPANAHTVQWSITDVFPKALWDERSQALQTRDFQVGATIGVFRAEVETAPDSNLHLMDVTVGMACTLTTSGRAGAGDT